MTSSFDLNGVQAADVQLMSRYIDILRSLQRFDPVLSYVAWHIRRHIARLRAGYVGEIQLNHSKETSEWLQARIDQLAEFGSFVPTPISWRTIFTSSKSATTAVVSMGAFLFGIPAATAGITAAVVANINSCYCHVLGAAWVASLFGVGVLVAVLDRRLEDVHSQARRRFGRYPRTKSVPSARNPSPG